MLRSVLSRASSIARSNISAKTVSVASVRTMSHGPKESEEEFDKRYVALFSRPDIDSWQIRAYMNDLCGMDLVPDPKIIIASLHACRRLNDYALTVRWLEAIENKCGDEKDIFPWILEQIRPTLTELGISTPAELGYDKPELALESVYEMH